MELRDGVRQYMGGKVRIHWSEPSGATFGCVGRCFEVSTGGMCIDIDRRIAKGSVVQIESHELKVVGLGIVRHCRQKGMGFRLGLQFSDGLKRIPERPSESLATVRH